VKALWQRFGTPVLVLVLALAIVVTLTQLECVGGKESRAGHERAYVRRDLTPLSTKVAGLVRAVKVGDYARVQKGDELVQLEDDDFRAQVAQAAAAVEAAKAAIENNRRQRELQHSRIQRALAGIDQPLRGLPPRGQARTPSRPTSCVRERSAAGRKRC
jgi:membrane fusion protein, multidrug efflux system